MPSEVFKIMTAADWARATEAGVYLGSPDDARDGFIHLSTAEQVPGTLQRHFTGKRDLIIAAFGSESLGSKLVFEASRGGAQFPHLYAPLPILLATRHTTLTTDDSGNSMCDPAWLTC
jgi:uncharacterized protein (DUF952 family)